MTLHVRDAGTWKTVTAPSVRDAGVWKTVQEGWVRDAGTWKKFFGGVAVNPPTSGVSTSVTASIVYAGMEFRNDGTLWRTGAGGGITPSAQGTDWLTSGTASQVWIERVISSGTLNHTDPGAGRLQLSTTRLYQVSDNSPLGGPVICTLTFNFYDAASGGNLLGTTGVQTISAERTGGA